MAAFWPMYTEVGFPIYCPSPRTSSLQAAGFPPQESLPSKRTSMDLDMCRWETTPPPLWSGSGA